MALNFFKINKGVALPGTSSAPSSPTNGDMYYDTTLSKFQFREGGSWTSIGGAGFVVNEAAQSGTSYTLALTDGSNSVGHSNIYLTNSSTVTITVPTNASVAFPVGTRINFVQDGTGAVMFSPAGGVTVNSLGGGMLIAGQYGQCTLEKKATDTWWLYGNINKGIIAATGGTITTDGNFKVHTFTTSGTFQITSGYGFVDSLVIAGGGGGGQASAGTGGGGGAGGLIYTTGDTLGVGSYGVTVGAGGPAGTGSGAFANGSNSVFNGHTATGGGHGSENATAATTGGSGGGGSGFGTGPGAAGTAGQGNSGGNGAGNGTATGGGGGGGAGSAGGNFSGTTGGAGGSGLANSITGTSVTYAGGGGGCGNVTGGAAGSGGGGAGANGGGGTGGTGTANTGGGGGGGGTTGAGGSGVVIIRYQFQ